MSTLARLVLEHARPGKRALIGIDGVDGSGKSTLSLTLARSLGCARSVVVIHLDDFRNESAVRHRSGRDSPEGFWSDTYDYDAIERYVLEPLSTTGNGRYRPSSYDAVTDRAVESREKQAETDAIVLIEGMFLHRDRLREVWDYSIFLDVPFEETARRMAARNGSCPDPRHPSMRRYVGGQQLYFAATRPWERASIVIDNRDPGRPCAIAPDEAAAASQRL